MWGRWREEKRVDWLGRTLSNAVKATKISS
ncbi:MAG: hypothetical protein ACJARR_003239 [Pseudophaeobacter arcticus]|jgi:hypothetical protein